MRLLRLDLTRYGKFTSHQIDFGARQPGQPDLHIVYGPNETGKSTALAAFLDLLFGIETQSRYSFLHPYATMRIGAALELDGGVREFVRIKRPQNSLLDGNEQPIAEGIILAELGGIDRESYQTMFSLDDDTLEAGGHSILASKGDLGELLFSASAGLADLSQTLVDLQAEADGFYKFRARSGELMEFRNRLRVLKEQREGIDTLASVHAQLVETRDRGLAQYNEAIGERAKIRSRTDEIRRHLNGLPRLAALQTISMELEPLAGLPEAPAGWEKDLPELQKEEIELSTRQDGIVAEISQLSDDIQAIIVDDAALRLAGRVDRLADARARYVTADKDIPERRLQLRETDLEISGILQRLEREGEADPKSLILGASTAGALRNLMENRSGAEAALRTAKSELAEAEQRLTDAQAKLKGAGGDPGQESSRGVTALVAALSALRRNDHAARRGMAEKSRTIHLEVLTERMLSVRPWEGNIEQLASIKVPEPSDIESWKFAIAERQKQIDRHAAEVEGFTTEQRRLKAEMAAIESAAGIENDQDAAAIRAAREDAWATHRRRLDAVSADAFEAMLRRDDIITNARLGHSKDVARLQQTRQSLAVVEADLGRASELLDAATASLQEVRDQIAAVIVAMAPAMPANMSLAQLEAWLLRRDKAFEARTNLRQIERDLREAEMDGQTARNRILDALAAAGIHCDPNASFDTLVATAQAAIDRETDLKNLRAQVEDRRHDVETRQRDRKNAANAEQEWNVSWAKVCSGCWLGETGAVPNIATVREILVQIAGLGPALEKQAGLDDRIRKMERDQRAFTEEVTSIATELGIEIATRAVLDLAHEVTTRVQQGLADQSTQAMKIQNLEDTRRRHRELSEAIAANEKRKAEMMTYFGVTSLGEVADQLRKVEKRTELRKRQVDVEREILDALNLPSLQEAESALDHANRAALENELGELKDWFDDQDQRTRELFTAHSKATDRLESVGSDAAVARIDEERQTILLEIEEKARRYVRQRLGIVAAERALRLYRDKHRGSMMIRASKAFQTISRGAYSGLTTQLEKDTEILIGIGADGSSKRAADSKGNSEMSKGTRFQLYLALRVAGYHEFASSRRPVPFIADDIMETFDDFRAEEAFRLFSEMAEVGQVIYLTHHRHLSDIAQRVCPRIKVHELPPANAQ